MGQLEIIERDEGPDYLRVIVKEGLVVGGQAIGKFADFIGLFMGAIGARTPSEHPENWPLIARSGSITPWTTRKLGELIGLKS